MGGRCEWKQEELEERIWGVYDWNLLYTFIDNYLYKFKEEPIINDVKKFVENHKVIVN